MADAHDLNSRDDWHDLMARAGVAAADRGIGRRDRARGPSASPAARRAARGALVPHAAAALARRPGGGAGDVHRDARVVRCRRRQHGMDDRAGLRLLAFGGLSAACIGTRGVRPRRRRAGLGAVRHRRADRRGGGRLSRHRPMVFRQRQPARAVARRAWHVVRARTAGCASMPAAHRSSAPSSFPARLPVSTATGT